MKIKDNLRFCRQAWYLCKRFDGNRLNILCDYLRLYRTKGLTTDEYYEFEFEKRSENFRNNFLGMHEQRQYLDLLNPVKYYIFARNKFLTHKLLEQTGVQKPQLYCYYQPEGKVMESSEIANNVADVCRILRKRKAEQFVVKTTESSHGDNVVVVKHIEYTEDDGVLHFFNGESQSLSNLLGGQPLIFESLVAQTAQIAAFNPSSVNTVRFMTTLYPDGDARLVATFIKIGRAGRCVDNAGGGGNVDACINLETGALQHVIQYDGWRNIQDITHHPDSGALLDGVIIQNWEAIKQQVLEYQRCFPYVKAAGWDIAITDDGPVVIEVNDMWDRTGQYFIRKGWRREIRDCYLSWKKLIDNKTIRFPYNGRLAPSISSNHLQKIIQHE